MTKPKDLQDFCKAAFRTVLSVSGAYLITLIALAGCSSSSSLPSVNGTSSESDLAEEERRRVWIEPGNPKKGTNLSVRGSIFSW